MHLLVFGPNIQRDLNQHNKDFNVMLKSITIADTDEYSKEELDLIYALLHENEIMLSMQRFKELLDQALGDREQTDNFILRLSTEHKLGKSPEQN